MIKNPDEPPSFSVSRQGAAEQVMGDLRNRICQGIYPRGAKLPSERELATYYRVSGPTIREALRGLAATNLVRMRKGMGVYVIAATDAMFASALGGILELEKAQLLDVLAVSEALYVKAVTLACEHATEEELRVIAQTLDLLDQRKAAEKLFEDLKTFLDLIARASHNVPLAVFCRFMMVLQVEVANEQIGGIPRNWETIAIKLRSDRRELVSALQARNHATAGERRSGDDRRRIRVDPAPSNQAARKCAVGAFSARPPPPSILEPAIHERTAQWQKGYTWVK
jgi:GntR family transcriptional regulator, transcriptional repressor for pyruvate dehydrogenase complex